MLITVEGEIAGYMVYDNLGLTGIYDKAGDAINRATKISGIVVPKMAKSYTDSQRHRSIIRLHRQSIIRAQKVWKLPFGIAFI